MKKSVWIGLGALALGAGLYVYKQYKLSQKLCFKAIGYTVKQVTSRGVILQVQLQIKNTDSLAVDVRGYSFDIYGNGVFLASVYSSEEFSLQPNSTTHVYANVAINPSDLVSNIGSVLVALTSWKNTQIRIKGKIKAAKFNLPFAIPVDYRFVIGEISEGESKESTC